jgi:ribose transport system ATP-binding protein
MELARHMVGREMSGVQVYRKREFGDLILDVRHLSSKDEFRDVSFQVRKGEILGFTGLLGDGRSELAQCLFGCRSRYSGEIRINGKVRRIQSPQQALRLKVGYVPKNRKENGIIKQLSVLENITIVTLWKYVTALFIDRKKEMDVCLQKVKSLNIRISNPGNPITSLSGGNQQKVVLAKWLEANPDILIFDNPTQGVDVGAKNEIYNLIMELADKGIAMLVMSSEPQEIMQVCDSVYVMYHGDIRGRLDRDQITEENIMLLSTGGSIA